MTSCRDPPRDIAKVARDQRRSSIAIDLLIDSQPPISETHTAKRFDSRRIREHIRFSRRFTPRTHLHLFAFAAVVQHIPSSSPTSVSIPRRLDGSICAPSPLLLAVSLSCRFGSSETYVSGNFPLPHHKVCARLGPPRCVPTSF